MASATATTVINQPVEKVFNYVIDVNNHLAWQAGIQAARAAPDGPVAVGTVYTYTSEVMGRKMDTAMKVSRFEPNTTWGVETTGVPRPVETVYSFAPEGSGTRLSISMELSGGFPAAAEAMVKQQMEKSLAEQATRIKQTLGG
jgi:uncharacterized protein YndB with AHSA1/START domain